MLPIALHSILLLWTVVGADKTSDLTCAACRVVVDELDYSIQTQDLNKTVDSGSFRIDPKGNQMTTKIPYTRSDTQLTNLLDTVCGSLESYGQSIDKPSGRSVFMRSESRDSKPLEIENITTGPEVTNWLKMSCESLVDDFNDEIKEIFMKNQSNPEHKICVDITRRCSLEQLTLNLQAPVIKKFESTEKGEDDSKADSKDSKEDSKNDDKQKEETQPKLDQAEAKTEL